jgi:hypothetical protein
MKLDPYLYEHHRVNPSIRLPLSAKAREDGIQPTATSMLVFADF